MKQNLSRRLTTLMLTLVMALALALTVAAPARAAVNMDPVFVLEMRFLGQDEYGPITDRYELKLDQRVQLRVRQTNANADRFNFSYSWSEGTGNVEFMSSTDEETTAVPMKALSAGRYTAITVTATWVADNVPRSQDVTWVVTIKEPAWAPTNSLTLDPETLTLNVGEVGFITAKTDAGAKVVWESSDTSKVRVNDNGQVTAVAVGEATITATARDPAGNDIKKTCKVTVNGIQIESRSVYCSPSTYLFDNRTGQTTLVRAVLQPPGSTDRVRWASSNEKVATVQPRADNQAQITRVGPGKATITATPVYTDADGKEQIRTGVNPGKVEITVSGLILEPTSLSLREGQRETLVVHAYGVADDGSSDCDWSSSDPGVATVTRGSVVARKSGAAVITAAKGNYSATCAVTVEEDTSAIITISGTAGSSYNFNNLLSRLQSVCSTKIGGTLSYITNVAVASTDQGILHDDHVSAADTGAGVGIQDRYYRSPNANLKQRGLSNLSFVPSTSFAGTAEISFTGWNTGNQSFNGLIRFTVNGTGDVMYASNQGSVVNFLAEDFNRVHPNFKSVSFTPPKDSVGAMYYNYRSSSQPGTKITAGTLYSRTGTPGLDDVVFVPAEGYQGAVRVAYKGTDSSGKAISGTVTITVTRAGSERTEPGDVSYSVREDGWLTMRPSDFNSASLRALGESLSYVRFTPPPSNEGTLFYNYRGFGDFDGAVDPTVSYYNGGSPSLGSVTFVPTTTTPDRVNIGYTGYTARGNTFSGTIRIVLSDYTSYQEQSSGLLHYTVFPGRTVSLNASDFNTACINATGRNLSSVQFTRLPTVSAGNLRYTWGNSSTPYSVTTGTRFYRTGTSSTNLIGNVYFQASSNYYGTVTLPFIGYAENGATFTAEAVISVTTPTSSEITYSGTTASPIHLSSARVRSACALDRDLSYIMFTSLPSSTAGKLCLGYSGIGTGTQVNTGTRYYASGYPSIDQLSFVPRGRYAGQVSIGYTAVSTTGQSVNGRIVFNITSTGGSSYFNDMYGHTWAAPSVDYLYQNQVTNGVTATSFGPNQRIYRCDFVLMLCRAFKFSGANGYSFSDVPTDAYFSQAVATAKQLGIVSGTSFRPYGEVTREDAMVMTYNALKAAGWNVPAAPDSVLSRFSDSASVSSSARSAVSSLVQMGAVNGDNGRLYPHNPITRAEAAVILHFVTTM